jgi:3',5'-cyclic AMP phosphodiesterase CpdA
MTVVAHLSDTHFDGSARNADRAQRVLAYLDSLPGPIDVVLVTGDIADHGTPDEYAEARKALDRPYPMLLCPGNHDERRAYREVLLGETPDAGPVNRMHVVAGVAFAMCDSSIPGRDDGYLDDETLTWLDRELAELAELAGAPPVFVCMHHPPVTLGSPELDAIRQFGAERLAGVLNRYPQVVAVLCGHAHTAAASTFAGRPVLVAPGVVSTLKLPWEGDEVLDYRLPPALAFHLLDDDRRLTTHYRVVP